MGTSQCRQMPFTYSLKCGSPSPGPTDPAPAAAGALLTKEITPHANAIYTTRRLPPCRPSLQDLGLLQRVHSSGNSSSSRLGPSKPGGSDGGSIGGSGGGPLRKPTLERESEGERFLRLVQQSISEVRLRTRTSFANGAY